MDEQEKAMLTEALQLSQENNKMLHAMRRQAHWSQVWGSIKWLLIIGSLIWSFYYLQPYLLQIAKLYQETQNVQSTSQGYFQNFLNDFQSGNQPTSTPKLK